MRTAIYLVISLVCLYALVETTRGDWLPSIIAAVLVVTDIAWQKRTKTLD